EIDAVEHTFRRLFAQTVEAPLEIVLVLAAQRVQAERAPHRRRVTADALASIFDDPQAFPIGLGGPDPAGVPTVRVLRGEPEQPVALPADEHPRARTLARRRSVGRAVRAVVRAFVGERAAAEETLDDFERVDETVEPLARTRHLEAERGVRGRVP